MRTPMKFKTTRNSNIKVTEKLLNMQYLQWQLNMQFLLWTVSKVINHTMQFPN